MSDGDGINFGPVGARSGEFRSELEEIGVFESLMQNGYNRFKMRASGDFWNNSAIGREKIDLRKNNIT